MIYLISDGHGNLSLWVGCKYVLVVEGVVTIPCQTWRHCKHGVWQDTWFISKCGDLNRHDTCLWKLTNGSLHHWLEHGFGLCVVKLIIWSLQLYGIIYKNYDFVWGTLANYYLIKFCEYSSNYKFKT